MIHESVNDGRDHSLMGSRCAGIDCDWERFLAAMSQVGLQPVLTIITSILSFFVAWALFELTERRKVKFAQRALRQALVEELRHAELLLSSIIRKYAFVAVTAEEILITARELRWFIEEAPRRAESVGLMEDAVRMTEEDIARLLRFSDEQLVALYATARRPDRVGNKLILPIVDAALAGRTAGFSATEIGLLGMVRWQLHLLEQHAGWMSEFFRLSYSVVDPDNHQRILENSDQMTRTYVKRAFTLVGCVRQTLRSLGNDH